MKFIKKIVESIKGIFSVKKNTDKTDNQNNPLDDGESIQGQQSTIKRFSILSYRFILRYLKKFIVFILGLALSIMQPMINISKKHPIAFWIAVILHFGLLAGLFFSNIERWEIPKQKAATSQSVPTKAISIDVEIIETERKRLVELEKEKQQKIETEIQKSETAKEVQKVAEQETLLAKAQREFAELKRQSEEEKTKEASRQKEISEAKAKEAEQKAKVATEQKELLEAETEKLEVKLQEITKKKELLELIAKQAETQAIEATRIKELAESKLNEISSKAIEAENLAKEAAKQKELAEAKAKEAEEQAKQAELQRDLSEEKAKEAEEKAIEAAKQKELADRSAQEAKEKAKEAAKQKELAEQQADLAKQLTEEERQKKDQLEAERAAQKEAFEQEQYQRLLTEEIQEDQDLERQLKIEDQLNTLKSAYVNHIAARVRSYWKYQGAEDDWGCDVYIKQSIEGVVEAVNVYNCTLDDSDKARSFKNSIERAVYKASPLPIAPDESVFDKEVLFFFRVN